MTWTQRQNVLRIDPRGRGLTEITAQVAQVVEASQVDVGLCVVFVRHTSASLVIQENADPSARRDLEAYLERLAPEGDPHYTHTAEGPDDMPAHLRSALTSTSESIPVRGGRLVLGTWQGLYLWEHRRRASPRELVVHVQGATA
ncbi:MAG: secondary thiamine-phosphate synthase enzyme YjbQ [Planctomycetota bacterium]